MSRKPFVAFYAGSAKSVAIPYTNVQNILEFAKANKVDYIVIDKRSVEIRDNYAELENLHEYSDKISLIFEDNSIYPIKVFKISL